MKTCKTCGILTDQYYKDSKAKDGLRSSCKNCDKKRVKKLREENKEEYSKKWSDWYRTKKEQDPDWYEAKKARENELNRERSSRNKKIINEFKSQGCSRCGYNEHPAALDCHHVGDKSFSIGNRVSKATEQEITEELQKCIVLCSNCHRIEHHSDS